LAVRSLLYMTAPKFIIMAPSFNELSGGAITLHLLCHRLNEAGETALLWPLERSLPRWRGNPRRVLGALRYSLTGGAQRYSIGPFKNSIARRSDLRDAIVVYPEITSGNPLGAKHVVRWLLYKPGAFTGKTNYGQDDLYFFALHSYASEVPEAYSDNKLDLVWFNDVYRDEGQPQREGTCYLLKKGADRPIVHDLDGSTLLDGLSPEEKAREFNRRSIFYSYDMYTMYSLYAAICGCVSVIIPEPGVSKEDWRAREEERYGLAYGEEDIPWALETRDKLLGRLQDQRAAEEVMLHRFISGCLDWYSRRSRPAC
jgi:hypothetical protein